jgi:hypothetical protein
MDEDAFDRLARGVERSVSRRAALAALTGLGPAALGIFGFGATAKNKK